MFVAKILMQMVLSCTFLIGFQSFENGSVIMSYFVGEQKHLNYYLMICNIREGLLDVLNNINLIILNFMDKSNTNSQPSNFFIISSQSSRSAHHKSRKEKYVKFARKVQDLLDAQGNDLDQLYRKLETIVGKYFHEHRIVQFAQMYEYISTLKSNSKKMNDIVSILEKRLSKESIKSEQLKNEKVLKGEQFETTSTTQKQTKNSIYQPSKKESLSNSFDEHDASVNTSLKYNHVFKPSIKSKNHQPTSNNHKQLKPISSPQKSPNSKKSFGEQYQTRNKQYELKVKKMMEELQQIKQKIKFSNNMESNLRIDLKPNEQKQAKITQSDIQDQIPSQNTLIEEVITNKQKQVIKQQFPIQAIVQNTSNITRQIQQLKYQAQRLQQYASLPNHYHQQPSINPILQNQFNKNKKSPILQKIQDTTSQLQISENMIPSFKYIANNGQETKVKNEYKNSTVINDQISDKSDYLSSSNIHASYPSNHHQNKYNVQTIKYTYNPSQTFARPNPIINNPKPFQSFVYPQPIPIQKKIVYYQNLDMNQGQEMINQRNSVYMNSPNNSSKSSTSILHPHLFNREKSAERSQFNARQPSFSNSFNNTIGLKDNMSNKTISNYSSSSIQRKGLNLTTSKT